MAKHNAPSARDQAGIGPHLRPGVRLVPLRELGELTLVDGEPDIRGWDVRTVSGREIGKVDDLLVDRASSEIVMLQIDLPGTNRHTLAPIRVAQIDRVRRVVLLDSAELRDERDVPSLARDGELTAEEVRRFSDRYDRAYGERGWDAERDLEVGRSGGAIKFGRRSDDQAADAERERSREVTLRNEEAAAAASGGLVDASGTPLRYAGTSPSGAAGAEQRPRVVEEVVVRRRVVEGDEARAADERTGSVDPRPSDRGDIQP